MKDKNTIIGFLLIFAILILFSILNKPTEEELKSRQLQDSINRVKTEQIASEQQVKEIIQEKVDTIEEISEESYQVATDVESDDSDSTYAFIHAKKGKEKIITISNNLLKIDINSLGGKIERVELLKFKKWDKTPLILYDKTIRKFGLNFFSDNRLINTDSLYFKTFINGDIIDENTVISASEENKNIKLSMRLYAFPSETDNGNDNKYIEFVYSISHNSYEIGFNIVFNELKSYISENTTFVNLDINSELTRQEKSIENEKNVTTVFYRFFDSDVDNLSERKDAEEALPTRIQWVSFKQQFFSFTLINNKGFDAGKVESIKDDYIKDKDYLKTMKASMVLPIERVDRFEVPMTLYIGPNSYSILRDMKIELERQIPIGWGFFLFQWINQIAVIPVFNYLETFGWNYGIIILVLTLMLKTVLFPIAYKTHLSSARMKVLKPEIEEISSQFPKKEDAMKKQQATMALYKKAGINPMAGCLPMLLQLPILIALFRFFPASIELRQQAFLWADDLSTYDSILELGFNIPFYGSHVSLFTLLMTISTVIYTHVNSKMMASTSQMPGMKTMMYLMPVMFLGFFNSFSAALSYYYFLTNMITFGQMYIFSLLIDEKKMRDKIEIHKKKPVKKSGFQKRLESMAKMKQQKQKRK